jgi:hypothetical protein
MQVPAATVTVGQPLGDRRGGVGGEVVQDHVHGRPAGHGGIDLFEEPQHVAAGVAFMQVGDDLPGGHVHRREQVDGAVALVVMGHRPGPATFHRQGRLGAVQNLALGLLIEAEHHRPCRRVQIKPDDINQFLLKPRIITDLEGVNLPRLEPVIGPDPGHRILTDPHPRRHRARTPMGRTVGRQLLVGQP